MNGTIEKWSQKSWICKITYLLTGVLFFWFPFEGLVLEPFGLHLLGFQGIFGLYIVTMICAIIAKKWLLLFVVAVGFWFIYAATLGFSEVLWYYLKTFFDIDYRQIIL